MTDHRLGSDRAIPGERSRGYLPLREYAAIGDGRTVALVGSDGSVDWLCLPDLDSPSVFGAILDSRDGGRFELEPEVPYRAERRYLPDTNVLETTFSTAGGTVRVIDAMTLPGADLGPGRELVRRIEPVQGRVPLRWRVEPRFGYAAARTSVSRRLGVPVASAGSDAVAVCSWSAGDPECDRGSIGARFEALEGESAIIAVGAAHGEPLVLPARDDVETRLDRTAAFWRSWATRRAYEGPWRDAVVRSGLALKLLVHAPSGAIAAAATTSLPESIGGERNWDYRFSWVRDSAFTLDAFLRLGCSPEAEAFFWWLMHASRLTHPTLQVLYRLDGGADAPETTLALEGYEGSRPVRIGNGAVSQRQLDVYGDLLQTVWLYAQAGNRLDREVGRKVAQLADLVCEIWQGPDSGIWEVRSEPVHFTHSKMMCWVSLDRAIALQRSGRIRAGNPGRWQREVEAIRDFVDSRCWSDAKRSYVRYAGSDELDASLLLAVLMGYVDPRSDRARGTVEAVRRELGNGPLLYRYTGEDGLSGSEGFFLTCSFWLVDALARCGRVDEAAETMEELLGFANDVGLYAEEVEPGTGEFLGNFPQGLVHLALVNAAISVTKGHGR